jgi:hypothetical protein
VLTLQRTSHGNYVCHDDPGERSAEGAQRISVTENEAALLADAARNKTVVEIGTGLGISTRALASTAHVVTTVDPDDWVGSVVAADLPPCVTHVRCVDDIPPDHLPASFAFIDGDHSFEAVVADLISVMERCVPGSEIYLHDGYLSSVRRAVSSLGLDYTEVVGRDGVPTHTRMLRVRVPERRQ